MYYTIKFYLIWAEIFIVSYLVLFSMTWADTDAFSALIIFTFAALFVFSLDVCGSFRFLKMYMRAMLIKELRES